MTGATPTTVAVALSTHDGAAHLEAQLASIAGQTRPPDRLVVRDDGSADATVEMLETFATTVAFDMTILRGAQVGLGASMAEVLEHCDTDLVALCDQDDVWMPAKLARAVARLEADPLAAAVVSNADLIDEGDRRLPGSSFEALGLTPRRLRQLAEDPVSVLAFRSVLSGHALVVRRGVVDRALPFPEAVSRRGDPVAYPDRWLSLVAGGSGPVLVLDERLVSHRQHDLQQTGVDARATVRAGREASRWLSQARTRGAGVRERLSDRADLLALAAERSGSDSLAAAAAHLRVRAQLPLQRRRRPGVVLGELRRGAYGWSGGSAVALADLLRPLDA